MCASESIPVRSGSWSSKKVGDGGAGARESVQLCKPGGDVPCDLVYASAEPPSWQNFAGGLNGRQEGKSKFSKPTKRR